MDSFTTPKPSLAREKLFHSIKKTVEPIALSYGPCGYNVVIEEEKSFPRVLNDGLTISRSIEFDDAIEDAGSSFVKEISGAANDSSGDGTTSTSIIASELLNFHNRLSTDNNSFYTSIKGFDIALCAMEEFLKEYAKPVTCKDDIINVASVSAGNQPAIGNLIAESLDRVGAEGAIEILDSEEHGLTYSIKEGMEIESGFLSKAFINVEDDQTCCYEKPIVATFADRITEESSIIGFLEDVSKSGLPLVMIVADIAQEVTAMLVANHVRGYLKLVVIVAPSFGLRQKNILQDISILAGSSLVSKDLGIEATELKIESSGTVRKVLVSDKKSLFIPSGNNRDHLEKRVKELKNELEQTHSSYDNEIITDRITRIGGGIALIYVGAPSESETIDLMLRSEDSKNSAFASIKGGILPGGGSSMVHAKARIMEIARYYDASLGEGINFFSTSLISVSKTLSHNSGMDGDLAVFMSEGMPLFYGIDGLKSRLCNLMADGIVDPQKSVVSSFKNATSISSILLKTMDLVIEHS